MDERTKRVVRQMNRNYKISFDFDGTLNTVKGKALAKRLITQGYTLYIISARNKNIGKSVTELGAELGINEGRIYLTGSNSGKMDKIKELGIQRHYANNKDVVKQLKADGVNAILTNY